MGFQITNYQLSIITLLLISGCAIWFHSHRFNLHSLHNVFLFALFYYALSVPIDLLLGFEIRTPPGMPDLNSSDMLGYVYEVLTFYLICAITFLLTYNLIPWKTRLAQNNKHYNIWLPPLWFLVLIHIIVLIIYINLSWDLNRSERALLSSQNVWYKLYGIIVMLLQALDFLYIIVCSNRRKSTYVLLLFIVIGVVAGSRTIIVLYPLVFIARWKIDIPRLYYLLICGLILILLIYWKPAYYYVIETFVGGNPSLISMSTPRISLSSIEAASSYQIFVDYLRRGDIPYWLGSTYVKIPINLIWPRFLSEIPILTLADEYMWTFRPEIAAIGGRMGFSALAESWLNFGLIGPAMLGAMGGIISKYFDSKSRGVIFYIFLLIIYRLFRSDAGELFKSWILVFGGLTFILFIILSLLHSSINMLNTQARHITDS